MTAAIGIIWAMLCAPIVVFFILDVDQQIRFNYSLIVQIVAPVAAALCCYAAGNVLEKADAMRRALIFLGTGVLSWGIGAILFALYPLLNEGQETPYPWYSDVGYLLLVPLILVAFVIFKRNLHIQVPFFGKIGATIFFLIALGLAVQFNLSKLNDSDSLLSYIVTLSYTVGDPLLLGGTVIIASILSGGAAARPWWLILVGLIFYYLADLVYTYLVLQGQYATGNPIDIGWPLGFGFIAVAALMIRSMFKES
ncbi:MAG TPA: hypothetical protein PKY50_09570 [Candidatus Competibacter sp.]|nr:hypothetical protein [Candidatus Competibacter sp.]